MVAAGGEPAHTTADGRERAPHGLPRSLAGRRALFAALYFAEGAPIGFVWWMLPPLLRRAGWEVDAIGALTAALVLPWGLKVLWAPLVDVLRGPRFGLRGWVVSSQLAMMATLAPLPWLESRGAAFGVVLFAHACAAATQDVAIDALAVRATSPDERGALNGWMQVGMFAGRGLFGGALLGLQEELGLGGAVALLELALAGTLVANLFYRPREARAEPGRWRRFGRALAGAGRRRTTWVVLAFAALGGAAFEVVGAMAGPLLVDRGFSDEAIGTFYALPALLALALGALVGGVLADRVGRRAVAALAGAALAVLAILLGLAPAVPALTWSLLAATYFGIGAFCASTYALFMDATDPSLGSTQLSAYFGATNLCEAWSARVGGSLARSHGYPSAFFLGAGVGLLALPLLALVPGLRRPREGGAGG